MVSLVGSGELSRKRVRPALTTLTGVLPAAFSVVLTISCVPAPSCSPPPTSGWALYVSKGWLVASSVMGIVVPSARSAAGVGPNSVPFDR